VLARAVVGAAPVSASIQPLGRPLRVGVIGCGVQGQVHLRTLRALGPEQVQVVAVCDLSETSLARAAEIWPEAGRVDDYRRLLEPGGLDLAIVATMPNSHAQICTAALQAGAHVLCEKPFMIDARQAEEVLQVAQACQRSLQLGTNMRYMRRSRYLRDLVASGAMGRPVVCKAWGCHHRPPLWGPNHDRSRSGGGALACTLVHGLDLALWVGGNPEPVSVTAAMRALFPGKRGPLAGEEIRAAFNVEDLLVALVRCADGSTYVLETNWCDELKNTHSFELITTRGTAVSEPFRVLVDEGGEVVDHTPQVEDTGWPESILLQDQEIVQRLRDGLRLEMHDRRQLLNLQRVIDACYASADLGREVRIDSSPQT
jgi:predicted dehydrogenase